MFQIKNKNPFIALIMGLCVLGLITVVMNSTVMQTETKESPFERGNVFMPKNILEPFLDKYNKKDGFDSYKPFVEKAVRLLEGSERVEYSGYIALGGLWEDALRNPFLYSGVLMPTKPLSFKDVSAEFGLPWSVLRVSLKMGTIFVHLADKPQGLKEEESIYLDLFYLGSVNNKSKMEHHGVAKRVYILPEKGILPRQRSDEVAIDEIVDEYKFPKESRNVSSVAFQHFLSKVQTHDDKKLPLLEGIGYSEVMDTPNIYRGKVIEVMGSLIHYEKHRLRGTYIKPGMEFYYECYLLDSDRLEYVVRCLDLPVGMKLMDVVKSRGYFMQRYNFHNRMNKVTWTPLVVSSKIEVLKEEVYGISPREKKVLLLVIGLLFLTLLSFLFRRKKSSIKVNKMVPKKRSSANSKFDKK